jgi:dTDP-4-dehydrorhamnose 3,5-epimerase
MKISTFDIEGLILIEPRVFKDDRGYFFESFNEKTYKEILGNVRFVQDNISESKKNVLRGLHFQTPPRPQGKLVSVLRGKVLDVAVDLRKGSSTYGKHQIIELSANDHYQFWIPPGFAHGFLALEENTVFSYKCTDFYSPENEKTLLWNDESLAIDWKLDKPIISEKDKIGEDFRTFVSPFN